MTYAGRTPTRHRRLLIGVGVAVVLVAGLLVGRTLLSGGDKPKLTYQGSAIGDPARVLQAAEASVAADVTARHGAESTDSRCYFTQSRQARSGQRKSDVGDHLLCGPVLFVDGDQGKAYLAVPLRGSVAGGTATLTPAAALGHAANLAVPGTAKLVRPDGKSAPKGSGRAACRCRSPRPRTGTC